MLFTNVLYVINMSDNTKYSSDDLSPHKKLASIYSEESENQFYNAFIHVYLVSLGDFSTDDYENRGESQKQVIWILFLVATFFI